MRLGTLLPRAVLALLYTEDALGRRACVHPGTRTSVAARRLRRRPFSGCYSGFRFDTKSGFLVMWLEGWKTLVDNHVGFLVVHSRRLNPGILDCIDS